MPATDWYFACDGQQSGPVSSNELKQVADTGKLKPDDLVWQEGMKEWIPARKVKGLFETKTAVAVPPPVSPAAPPMVLQAERPKTAFERSMTAYQRSREGGRRHPLDALLALVRNQFAVGFVVTTTHLFALVGYYGLYATMAILLIAAVVDGVAAKDGMPVLWGLVGVALLAIWQYVAGRFLAALDRLVRSSQARLSSTIFIDFWALLHMLLGLAALIACSILAMRLENVPWILPGLALFVLGQYTAVLALNPEFLGLTITSEAGESEEALGLVTFFAKLSLRMAPVAFGTAVVWLTLRLVFATLAAGLSLANASAGRWQGILQNDLAIDARPVIFLLLLWPLWAYLSYLFYQITVDLLRGLLSLPDKIDQLGGEKPKGEG
jgi:hypothetical protein